MRVRKLFFFVLLIMFLFPLSIVAIAQDDDDVIELDPNCLGKDEAFAPFFDYLTVYCDDEFMYIDADSLADHDMMIGITAWNQQVPLPQHFFEENSWRIPMNPVMADEPSPTTGQGPIAVAVNGVMIYNPTQQDGIYDPSRDPFLIGELDTCGGHAGRADDYHYHIAPLCIIEEFEELTEETNYDMPIGYVLDGFPLYGFFNPDGTLPELDECGGEFDDNGLYHYHAVPDFPYVNACFMGEVDLDLQPHTEPIRPAGEPIRVLITEYYEDEDGWIRLEYEYEGVTHAINYRETGEEGCWEFQFVDDIADVTSAQTETYCGSLDDIGGNPPPPPNGDGNGNPPPPPPNGG